MSQLKGGISLFLLTEGPIQQKLSITLETLQK